MGEQVDSRGERGVVLAVAAATKIMRRDDTSVAYPVISQAVKDQTFAITGRNDAFT